MDKAQPPHLKNGQILILDTKGLDLKYIHYKNSFMAKTIYGSRFLAKYCFNFLCFDYPFVQNKAEK